MLCESCNDREATVHLTKVIDGSVEKVHLCEECAAKSGFDIHGPISISDILVGMGGAPAGKAAEPDRTCPRCHMRRADFKKTGRLGCPSCYQTFEDELLPLVQAMHRTQQHSGKIPANEGVRVHISAEITKLQGELDKAIAAENFEDAARLRDQIHGCKLKIEESEKQKGAP
jgi:protein arginine kinase activator